MRIIFCVLFIMAALPAYAVSGAELRQLYNTSDAPELMNRAKDTNDIMWSDFESIKQQIEQLNPKLVKKYSDKPMEEQIVAYRNYLAQQAYQYYKDYYIKKIEDKSKETGRKVKTRKYGKKSDMKEVIMWLDNGRLDLPECREKGKINSFLICQYPAGHEEVIIDIQSYDYTGNYEDGITDQIVFYQDDAANNRTIVYSIKLDANFYGDKSMKKTQMF